MRIVAFFALEIAHLTAVMVMSVAVALVLVERRSAATVVGTRMLRAVASHAATCAVHCGHWHAIVALATELVASLAALATHC